MKQLNYDDDDVSDQGVVLQIDLHFIVKYTLWVNV